MHKNNNQIYHKLSRLPHIHIHGICRPEMKVYKSLLIICGSYYIIVKLCHALL